MICKSLIWMICYAHSCTLYIFPAFTALFYIPATTTKSAHTLSQFIFRMSKSALVTVRTRLVEAHRRLVPRILLGNKRLCIRTQITRIFIIAEDCVTSTLGSMHIFSFVDNKLNSVCYFTCYFIDGSRHVWKLLRRISFGFLGGSHIFHILC